MYAIIGIGLGLLKLHDFIFPLRIFWFKSMY